ncbi:MAG: hypothetical protein NT077_04155 [Candidatus Taylorbacteria bacterium]|nr:hypothetical protein [Candidatus Taylorbacteria bacterium]
MEKITTDAELVVHKESGWFDGKRYNVGHLFVWAKERFAVEDVDVEGLLDQISDLDVGSISLDNVDSDKPILLSHTNHIIDGRHRLYKAVVEKRSTIRAIRLPKDLPPETEL